MKAARWAVVVILVCSAPGSARASGPSEALSARGLIELQAGKAEAARALFEQAVEADPRDAAARYYKALAENELGRTDQAIADLQAALSLRPAFPAAAFELGMALVKAGRNEEAIPWLEQAQADPRFDGRASFFLGLAQLRLGRSSDARANLQRARAKDPDLTLASRYYEGVAEYRAGNPGAAVESFTLVRDLSPESAMGREAQAFLNLLRRGPTADYHLYASLGLEYDTNVILAPDTNVTPTEISDQADGSVSINAGGTYVPWRNEQWSFTLAYDFFQSLYFRLHDFNLQDQRPSVQLAWDPGPLQVGLVGQYDFYLRETSSLLQDVGGLLWLNVPEGEFGRTEGWLRMRNREYFEKSFDQLDAFNYAMRVGQFVNLGSPERVFGAGIRLAQEDTHRNPGCTPDTCGQYSYNSIGGDASLGWRLTPGLDALLVYRYTNDQYVQTSSSFDPMGPRRLDREQRVIVSFNQQLTDFLWLNWAFLGTWNNSNKTEFDYSRQIVLAAIEARL